MLDDLKLSFGQHLNFGYETEQKYSWTDHVEALKSRPMQCFGTDQNLFSTKTGPHKSFVCTQDAHWEWTEEQSVIFICLGRHTNTKTAIPELTGDEVAVGATSPRHRHVTVFTHFCCRSLLLSRRRWTFVGSSFWRRKRRSQSWRLRGTTPGFVWDPGPCGPRYTRRHADSSIHTHPELSPTSLKITLAFLCNKIKWDTSASLKTE